MPQCTNCGNNLKTAQNTCDVCGVATAFQERQRVCMNCGSPAAEQAQSCMMCGHPIDSLPRQAATFSVSWPGIIIGLAIVAGLVYWFIQAEPLPATGAEAVVLPTATAFFIPPTATVTPSITPTPSPAPTATPTATPTPAPLIHTIKTGESLSFISSKYNVSIEEIQTANNLTDDSILRPGQELVIPFVFSSGIEEGLDDRPIIEYTIKSGDTLSAIAFEYDTTISAIELANPGIDLDLLSVGQLVIVPLKPPTETPTPTVTPSPTFTPRPPYLAPALLTPFDSAIVEGDGVTPLLSWTSVGLLDEHSFYVVFLSDETGNTQTLYTQATSYRLPAESRPAQLTAYEWYVVVMEEVGIDDDGTFYGQALSNPSETRSFQWR